MSPPGNFKMEMIDELMNESNPDIKVTTKAHHEKLFLANKMAQGHMQE